MIIQYVTSSEFTGGSSVSFWTDWSSLSLHANDTRNSHQSLLSFHSCKTKEHYDCAQMVADDHIIIYY